MTAHIQTRYDWPGIHEAVKKYVEACLDCQQKKGATAIRHFPLLSIESGIPNELLQVDHLKLSKAECGHVGVLVFVDHFTKYAEAIPYKNADAPETAKLIFGTWIARHGVPMAIQSDNGPAFAAELQREFVAIAGSLKIYSSPVHPSTNGLVERQNRSLISILRATCTRNQGEWIDHLPHALGAYNCMKHASTGFTPNMLMLNKERRYSLALLFPEQHPKAKNFYVRDLIRRAAHIHQVARQNLKQAHVR